MLLHICTLMCIMASAQLVLTHWGRDGETRRGADKLKQGPKNSNITYKRTCRRDTSYNAKILTIICTEHKFVYALPPFALVIEFHMLLRIKFAFFDYNKHASYAQQIGVHEALRCVLLEETGLNPGLNRPGRNRFLPHEVEETGRIWKKVEMHD